MADSNGHQDNSSRLDRAEVLIDKLILLNEKVVTNLLALDERLNRTAAQMAEMGQRLDEMGGKLDALIYVVDNDHREFHARLNRLEGKQ